MESHEATREIISIYRDSLVGYLESHRVGREEAADIVHDFLSERLIDPGPRRSLFDQYRLSVAPALNARNLPAQRMFAAYLSRALRNFYIDSLRRAARKEREIPYQFNGSDDDLELCKLESPNCESVAYDLLFAQRFLDRLLERTRQECLQDACGDVWQVLDARLIQPALSNGDPESYRTLAERLNLRSPQEATYRLEAGIRRFQRNLRQMARSHASLEGHSGLAAHKAASELIDRVCDALTQHGVKLADFAIRENLSCNTSTGPAPISRLLFTRSADLSWSTGDLRDMWRQVIELSLARLCTRLQLPAEFQQATLPELWAHANPPIVVLSAIKKFARESARQQAGSTMGDVGRSAFDDSADQLTARCHGAVRERTLLPSQLGFVIYVISIAVAKMRHDQLITKDGLSRLMARLEAVVTATWLDPQTHSLVVTAISRLSNELR